MTTKKNAKRTGRKRRKESTDSDYIPFDMNAVPDDSEEGSGISELLRESRETVKARQGKRGKRRKQVAQKKKDRPKKQCIDKG